MPACGLNYMFYLFCLCTIETFRDASILSGLSSSNLPDQGVLWFMTHQSSGENTKKSAIISYCSAVLCFHTACCLRLRTSKEKHCSASPLLVLMQDLIHIAFAVAGSVCRWLNAAQFVTVFIFRSSARRLVNIRSFESAIFLPPVS